MFSETHLYWSVLSYFWNMIDTIETFDWGRGFSNIHRSFSKVWSLCILLLLSYPLYFSRRTFDKLLSIIISGKFWLNNSIKYKLITYTYYWRWSHYVIVGSHKANLDLFILKLWGRSRTCFYTLASVWIYLGIIAKLLK